MLRYIENAGGEAFLNSIIDNIPLNIFIKDAKELRYVLMNRYAEELLGIPREQLLGKTDHDLFPREVAEQAIREDREVFARGVILEDPEDIVVIPGQGERIFHTRKVPLHDKEGMPIALLGLAEDVTERKRAEEASRQELVLRETQKALLELIRQLSTPVLPIHDGILVVPLVGQMDSARSAQLTEGLLSGIERHRAQTVLIDVTGVSVIDAAVADDLLRTTRAASLLGATCVLVGVAPDVARALVELGVDLAGLITKRDLQAGIGYALARQSKGIVDRGARAPAREPPAPTG
jgi:PAS domain S-box-containing protein